MCVLKYQGRTWYCPSPALKFIGPEKICPSPTIRLLKKFKTLPFQVSIGLGWARYFAQGQIVMPSLNKAYVITHYFSGSPFKCITLLLIYVDDILILGMMNWHCFFETKYCSHLFTRKIQTASLISSVWKLYQLQYLSLSWDKYTKDLIHMARMLGANPVDTPMVLNVKYSKNNGNLSGIHLFLCRTLVSYLISQRLDQIFPIQFKLSVSLCPTHVIFTRVLFFK